MQPLLVAQNTKWICVCCNLYFFFFFNSFCFPAFQGCISPQYELLTTSEPAFPVRGTRHPAVSQSQSVSPRCYLGVQDFGQDSATGAEMRGAAGQYDRELTLQT